MKTSSFMKTVFFVVFVLLVATLASAARPRLTITESGNITQINSNILTGFYDVESGYKYQAFIAILGNYSYFNNSISSSETIANSYNRTFDEVGFSDNRTITRWVNNLTISHKIYNNFTTGANISMHIPIPVGCNYLTSSTNVSFLSSSIGGGTVTHDYYPPDSLPHLKFRYDSS